EVRRFSDLKKENASLVVGNAKVLVDGQEIYTVQNARVGTFVGIDYPDYPLASENSRGGRSD
ncbi:MAG: 3-hydroxyacyl-[acyl-carrier protein] dehydratase/trans-2-decenoyl-[acyl-carrier protein] isomerase, partial [Myxococcota bacterium]